MIDPSTETPSKAPTTDSPAEAAHAGTDDPARPTLLQVLNVVGRVQLILTLASATWAFGTVFVGGDVMKSCDIWLHTSYAIAVLYFVTFYVLVFLTRLGEEFFTDSNAGLKAARAIGLMIALSGLLVGAGVYLAFARPYSPWLVLPSICLTLAYLVIDRSVLHGGVLTSERWKEVIEDAVRLDLVLAAALFFVFLYGLVSHYFGSNDHLAASSAVHVFSAGASAFAMIVSTLYFSFGVRQLTAKHPEVPHG